MTEQTFLQSILLTTGALVFMGLLIALGGVVAFMRRQRVNLAEDQRSARLAALPSFSTSPLASSDDATADVEPLDGESTSLAVEQPEVEVLAQDDRPTDPLPLEWHTPVIEGARDTLTFSIVPDEAPTRDQQNVKRLISYLRSEVATRAATKQA